MMPEAASALETNAKAKTAHCANVMPNKVRVFIGLVGSESDKVRINKQGFCSIHPPVHIYTEFTPGVRSDGIRSCFNSFSLAGSH